MPHVVAADAFTSDLQPVDLVAASPRGGTPPDVLAKLPIVAPTATPVPPAPTPEPPLPPQWASVRAETRFRPGPGPDDPAAHFLPKASSLKILESAGGRYRVYYGGNGADLDPGEGWVDPADLDLTQAPRWVEARRGTVLWSSETSRDSVGALEAGAVVEVLEDRGRRLRVFYLGDGDTHSWAEGWVDVVDLGPAGPLIVAERWGLRLLTREHVKRIEGGEGIWLRVPYRTQLDGSVSEDANCGPASVGMALQHFKVAVPTTQLRSEAEKLQRTSDPDLGFSIEFLKGTVERFGKRGLDLETSPQKLKTWTLDDVRRHISQGHPVIVELRFRSMPGRSMASYGEDHYVVLTGMLGDDFIFNDSIDVDGPGYGRLMSAAELKRAWGTSYFPFAAFAVSAP